jgi:hypothetical protein
LVIEIELGEDKERYINEIYNIIAELKPPSKIVVIIQYSLLFFMLGVGLGLIFIMW